MAIHSDVVNLPAAVPDRENEKLYSGLEESPAREFDWFQWLFPISPEMDAVRDTTEGIGIIYFRVFSPDNHPDKEYPLILNMGGLGSTNSNVLNGYASVGTWFAYSAIQESSPCYVVTMSIPYEACVNMEAEMVYMYQIGELVKWLCEDRKNIDKNRIYATGASQGASWCYELASVQPDLLAAILVNAGTTVHTTWGDQCNLRAIALSGVNIFIWHGYDDVFIPVNEAFRAYRALTAMGKKNICLDIDHGKKLGSPAGHTNPQMYSRERITPYVKWLFEQRKDRPFTETPLKQTEGNHTDYRWAGAQVFEGVKGWQVAHHYADWIEPFENSTWNQLKEHEKLSPYSSSEGKTWLCKIRIGDETCTSYDHQDAVINAGDVVAVTIQGYMGVYGDDWISFNKEWKVDSAVLQGAVSEVCLTRKASSHPVIRPASVTLNNGGGPNVSNSLFTVNALDGHQVYIRIKTEKAPGFEELKVALRFTRVLDNGEYASYYHLLKMKMNPVPYSLVQKDP